MKLTHDSRFNVELATRTDAAAIIDGR